MALVSGTARDTGFADTCSHRMKLPGEGAYAFFFAFLKAVHLTERQNSQKVSRKGLGGSALREKGNSF